MLNKKTYSWFNRHKTLAGVLCLFALSAFSFAVNPPPQNSVPPVETKANRIHLLRANTLDYDKSVNADFQILRGDVQFRQDSSYMYCDSAYFYEQSNSLDAFGNVRMEQGDTLFVYGDVLYYNGNTGLARLRDNVRMINRDVTLTTDSLNYDRIVNIGYFFEGGVITDLENRLTSIYGEYSPDTKYAIFQQDVELQNPKYTLYSDTLRYSTDSGIADILGESVIVSDSNTIYSDLGWYDTRNDLSMLLNRSRLVSKGQILIGDTIYYDRKSGYGEVFGNMFMNDSTRKIILEGNYGYYNEITEYAFVTQVPQAIEYSRGDSLYLHADTLRSQVVADQRELNAYYGVRFFRTDAQGVCDSLKYSTLDSTLVMYRNPVIWNYDYQIFGDTIFVLMNDSTIKHATVKDFAFLAQFKEGDYYDQLTGKVMNAWFENGELYKMQMDGNVQAIFYPEESDKSLIGLNKAESSYLNAFFKERKLEKMSMWPKVNGSLTPIPKLMPDQLYLPSFHWYSDLRPKDRFDIFRKVKMRAEDVVTNTRLFSKEELEGTQDLDLPEVEQKVRPATKNNSKSKPVKDENSPVVKDSLTNEFLVPDTLSVPFTQIADSLRGDSRPLVNDSLLHRMEQQNASDSVIIQEGKR
ncbi:MAG: OstA-like protein [Bacteroidales bacterium]